MESWSSFAPVMDPLYLCEAKLWVFVLCLCSPSSHWDSSATLYLHNLLQGDNMKEIWIYMLPKIYLRKKKNSPQQSQHKNEVIYRCVKVFAHRVRFCLPKLMHVNNKIRFHPVSIIFAYWCWNCLLSLFFFRTGFSLSVFLHPSRSFPRLFDYSKANYRLIATVHFHIYQLVFL